MAAFRRTGVLARIRRGLAAWLEACIALVSPPPPLRPVPIRVRTDRRYHR